MDVEKINVVLAKAIAGFQADEIEELAGVVLGEATDSKTEVMNRIVDAMESRKPYSATILVTFVGPYLKGKKYKLKVGAEIGKMYVHNLNPGEDKYSWADFPTQWTDNAKHFFKLMKTFKVVS